MINLLPDETKRQLGAAHTNISLIQYIVILGAATIFLALACATSYIFITNSKTVTEKLEDNNQSTAYLYSVSQKKLDAITSSLSTAKTILDQEVSYSDIIAEIAAALPSGTILDKLIIDGAAIGAPLSLQAHAKTADNVSQIKDNFAASTLFSSYSLESVSTDPTAVTGHPVVIKFSITINKGTTR